MTVPIAVIGDRFMLCSLLADAIRAELGDAVSVREHTLGWPDEPFGPVAEVDEACGDEDEAIAALAGARVGVTQMAPLTRRVLDASPDLELFAVARGGPVNANLEAATRHGVAVTFAPGRNADATAEHAVGLMLAAARRIAATDRELAGGRWRADLYRYDRCGFELGGSVVGLIGCGAVGRRVARIAGAFGARVLAYDPHADPGDVAERVELDELLAGSQIVSLHARLTAATRGIIGAPELAAMRSDALLVNTARAGLVDYDAVCDALAAGRLAAAAFDVFPQEPLPADARLRRTPNVVMTPHIGGASRETAHRAARIVAADVARHIRGERALHCANPEVLSRSARAAAAAHRARTAPGSAPDRGRERGRGAR